VRLHRAPLHTAKTKEEHVMVNIYLFIELLHTANAATTVDTLKALEMQNCKFANVVALSDEKLGAARLQGLPRRRQSHPHQHRQGRGRGADQYHRRRPPQEGLTPFPLPSWERVATIEQSEIGAG
jgi:hypothetical protein